MIRQTKSSHPEPPRAKKSLGQNFLVDGNTARKIVGTLGIGPGDRVLEIGPGRGALTKVLYDQGCRVVALEKDETLALHLMTQCPGVDVAVMDALDFSWERMPTTPPWAVISNLPYNVASPILWEFASRVRAYSRAVFTVQREVAQRIVASPGSRAYGALSVWLQTFSRPSYGFTIGPDVFRPRPKVHSGVVILIPALERPESELRPALAKTLKWFFSQRRKQIGTILKAARVPEWDNWLKRREIDPKLRPECLTHAVFLDMATWLQSVFFS